ncbi:chloride channel D [Perilla frutescens var. hirtella]|uniref:Chloride channel protein n=1 Tax=Perilla frutescens var. hirtella TaxID=608512 RepID=A0AAD4JQB9_PERFH|nr:chloride channel D [Perilla frutescens var. frutescens]KAH6788099.1 chloride channel D [Perilla frutescens var. hirtella]KAH6838033.1 chloride channel D [Perilla frutescens var. hirtella]
MLSNHLQNGMETAKLIWSRLPNSEAEAEDGAAASDPSRVRNGDGSIVESLDYEVIENYAYRQEQAKRGKLYMAYSVVVKWLMALLIGIGTALAAVFINISVENFAGWKYSWTFNLIQKSYFAGFVVYTLINLALVLSSVYIITQFSPAAAGSGIPEIKGYLNGIDTHGILLFRTLVGKIFGSIGSVGGGLALGKEGPLVHIGACIASLLGQGGSTKYHLRSRWLQIFTSERDRRDLVTCGCAAGVAAAFRAPVGGVLFALEEVTSWWRSQLMWRVFFTSAIVAVVVRTAMAWCKSGKCGHFGSGGFIIWDISGGQEDYSFQELLPMAVIGVIGGLLGALFNQLTFHIAYWRRNYLHKRGNRVKVIEVCIVSVITSVISFGLPLFRKCTPCPEADANSGIECPRRPGMYGNYVNFYCGDKEYNDLATIFFNTQDDAIRNLFSAKTIHEFSAQSLLTFLVMFYSLAVLTFGTAVPAGQFVPGIMIGSTYGRLVGMFVVNFYQKLNIEEGTYALLGAASFLGGSMRMTVSLCVIMVEISNNLKFLPLIMLVLLISKAVGDAFNEGLYEEQARLRGIPLLESRPKYQMRNMTAKEASGNQQVVYFPRVVKVVDILSILRSNNHNGFPVIDHTRSGEMLVIGLILRSHLLVLLQSKVDFQHSPLPFNSRDGPVPIRHNLTEFVKPVSSKGISIDDIHLTPDDLEMYIDLAPFLNPSPYVVPEDMSLTKVYNLFRQLGLRHLLVVPRASRVIGMITREDLLIEDHDDTTAIELQSTSVRDRQGDRRVSRRKDAEQPLLDGLLV